MVGQAKSEQCAQITGGKKAGQIGNRWPQKSFSKQGKKRAPAWKSVDRAMKLT